VALADDVSGVKLNATTEEELRFMEVKVSTDMLALLSRV